MKLYIDADGCPVTQLAIETAQQYAVEVILLCDTAHQFQIPGVTVMTVDQGADAVDFRLVNLLSRNDIVITQDYGLAAMCLARNALVLNQDGMIYHQDNMDALLLSRHTARKIRNAGGRLKGASKRNRAIQDPIFVQSFKQLLQQGLEFESKSIDS